MDHQNPPAGISTASTEIQKGGASPAPGANTPTQDAQTVPAPARPRPLEDDELQDFDLEDIEMIESKVFA